MFPLCLSVPYGPVFLLVFLSLSLSPPHMGPSILPDSPLPPCRRDSLLIPGSLELMN